MPDSDDELKVFHLTSVRTCQIDGSPNHVVLEIKAEDEAWHFILRVEDLATLGKRMTQDAQLLKA